ncbi:unnamed protein product [Peniophora sp. CBMAI 1063]|nr:unnamed protein product [Peniophora sp. CBMAI 1063]
MFPPRAPAFRDPLTSPSAAGPVDADAPVRATDNDAALARLSAVQKGYLTDPFIAQLVPRAHLQPARPPLINIGTYLRGKGLDELVESFIHLAEADDKKAQIVSVGAGSDTRFWRLATGPLGSSLARYVELDMPENTSRKAMAIRKSRTLNPVLGSDVRIGGGGTSLHSPIYNLLPVDLRHSPSTSLGPNVSPLLDPALPTLVLCECVLAYLHPSTSDALLTWFGEHCKGVLGVAIYEMFGLNDSFGRVMKSNLKSRNVDLPGAEPFDDLQSLPRRFIRLGFTTAHALTLRDIRRDHVESKEQVRISRLEMLDEVEELELVLQHYAISWGIKLTSNASSAGSWEAWGISRKS